VTASLPVLLLVSTALIAVTFLLLFDYASDKPWLSLSSVGGSMDQMEAHILKGRLEAEGVPAFVFYEHHAIADWSVINAIGGVKVMVPGQFVEEAIQLVSKLENHEFHLSQVPPDLDLKLESEDDKPVCPKCGEESVIAQSNVTRLFLFWVFISLTPSVSLDLYFVNILVAVVFLAILALFYPRKYWISVGSIILFLIVLYEPIFTNYFLAIIVMLSILGLIYPGNFNNTSCSSCFHRWYSARDNFSFNISKLIIVSYIITLVLGMIGLVLISYFFR